MTDKSSLADRCEAATGSEQRGLLTEAFHTIHGFHPGGVAVDWEARWMRFYGLLDAEAFLDAAMTLVPGISYAIIVNATEGFTVAKVGDCPAKAATPALALCAASLRASAAQEGRP